MEEKTAKPKGILFSAPMVKALLDGRKVMTRRIVAPSNSFFGSAGNEFFKHCDFNAESCFADGSHRDAGWYLHVPCHCQDQGGFKVSENVRCEYCIDGPGGWEGTRHRLYSKWEVGDVLYVRETWGDRADYAAIGKVRKDRYYYAADGKIGGWKYRPSIHMPRVAARIWLEITGVKVERLQDISEEDAKTEGVKGFQNEDCSVRWVDPFRVLWDELNADRGFGWDQNPWCWCVSFRRIEKPEGV